MKRKTLYNFNYVQLTFNQCVFNRIQYRTEQIVYSTRLDNSTGNSALQFRLHFVLTISSDEFVLTNSTYNWPYNVGWPKWVKRSEPPSSDSTVVQSGCLVSRPSLVDANRIGRSNGKGNPWPGQFLVALFGRYKFPIMDLSPGPNPATLNENCWCRWFYTYFRRFIHVYLRVRVYLPTSCDLKFLISKVSCFYLLYITRI